MVGNCPFSYAQVQRLQLCASAFTSTTVSLSIASRLSAISTADTKSLKRLPNLVSPTVSKQFPQEARSMHPTLLRDLSPPISSPVFLTRYVLWLCNPYSLWRLSIPWCRHPHPSPRSTYNLVLDFHPLNSFRVLRSASKSVHGYNLVLRGIRFARQRLLLFSKYQTANAIPHGRLMQGCTYHRAFAIPSTYAQELSTCSWHGSKATQLPSHSL